MNLFNLKDKNVLITGASRGLGRAMAVGMAQAGAKIIALGRDKDALAETFREISDLNGIAIVYQVDICDDNQVREMVDKVMGSTGRVDILVNNAGISAMNRTTEISKSEWHRIIDTNLNSVFNLSQIVGKIMIDNGGGNIINIASVLGKMASNRSLHYCASKTTIIHMTRALALE